LDGTDAACKTVHYGAWDGEAAGWKRRVQAILLLWERSAAIAIGTARSPAKQRKRVPGE
jgi:hypothetical protein